MDVGRSFHVKFLCRLSLSLSFLCALGASPPTLGTLGQELRAELAKDRVQSDLSLCWSEQTQNTLHQPELA